MARCYLNKDRVRHNFKHYALDGALAADACMWKYCGRIFFYPFDITCNSWLTIAILLLNGTIVWKYIKLSPQKKFLFGFIQRI